MTTFRGSWQLVLDSYGRMSIPVKISRALKTDMLVLFLALDPFPHVRIYTEEVFEEFVEKLVRTNEPDTSSPAHDELEMYLYSLGSDVRIDSRSRIVIPRECRESARLEREVVVKGARDHLAVYSEEVYEEYCAKAPSLSLSGGE